MKKYFLSIVLLVFLSSCERFNSSYEQRVKGVQEVIKNGIYIRSKRMNIAVDTTSNPNKIYQVYFCSGWVFPSYKVDHLVKIN